MVHGRAYRAQGVIRLVVAERLPDGFPEYCEMEFGDGLGVQSVENFIRDYKEHQNASAILEVKEFAIPYKELARWPALTTPRHMVTAAPKPKEEQSA